MLHIPSLTSQWWIFTGFVSRWDPKCVQKSWQKYFLLYFLCSSSFHSSPSTWDMFGVGNLCSDKILRGEQRGSGRGLSSPHSENARHVLGVPLCSGWGFLPGKKEIWTPQNLGGQGLRFAGWKAGSGHWGAALSSALPPRNELFPPKSCIAVKERFYPHEALIKPRNSCQ